MNKTLFFLFIAVICIFITADLTAKVIAFDLTKAETAGNADWTIGTAPNYVGAYSTYGEFLRMLGYTTTTLTGSTITSSMLNGVSVLIIPEPQNSFSSSERTLIWNFINSGGGVFFIADHNGSDRNNNGWDSRRVYNESLLTPNLGITFNADNLYAVPTNLVYHTSLITYGVTSAGMYAGCSITPSNGAITHVSLRNANEKGLVTNTYGQGRIAGWGDSSTFDDGVGNSGNDLYNNLSEYNNSTLSLNIVKWLAKDIEPTAVDDDVQMCHFSIYPNPLKVSSGKLTVETPAKTHVSLYNIKGQRLYSKYFNDVGTHDVSLQDLPQLSSGIYFVRFIHSAQTRTLKLLFY